MKHDEKRVNIYGRSDNQLRCMYAEWYGYILHVMSALALCIHVGMSACFARPFVHQSIASARLSVRLMIVYHCAHRFIFRPSICLIFRACVRACVHACMHACMHECMYVCMYVRLYLCRDELSGHRKLN